ncbi:TatD family hydrolase [Bacteriovoracaceae bacterium]|nr:TatD family hydrolase [Bacteriovoracaceae bacterium]
MSKKPKREIPILGSPIIETHCHLDHLQENDPLTTLKEAFNVGIEKVVTIATNPDNLDVVLDLANQDKNLFCTQGIHPHNAKDCTVDTILKIDNQLKESKVVAVGEIGLDYYYNKTPREKQIDVFKEHLELAIKHELPVVIHSRDAEDDTIEILNQYAPRMKKKGVIHSFTSELRLAECAISHGFYLGYNGIITFKNAQNVRDALAITPLNRILTETDSPYLTPIPYRGKENAPKYLPFILEKIAEIKNVSVDEALKVTYQNAHDLFFRLTN